MNATSAKVAPEIDEFALSGLTPSCQRVSQPTPGRRKPCAMECRLRQVIHVSDQPGGGSLVLGDVLCFHVDESILNDHKVDPGKLNAIGRMGGPTYVRTRDRFDMLRPK
jgi:flavin reductase (DIM6/NTAB) family NADH-FMN oxidoreductase RutF